jgi:hypothetical protein
MSTWLRTPAMLTSFVNQRRWERRTIARTARPWRVRLVERIYALPYGHIAFALLCFGFFGVDVMTGVVGGFDIANQRLEEAKKEHGELSKKMLTESNKKFEQKLEVLDMTRRAKEMGPSAAFESGSRSPIAGMHYGGLSGKQIPAIPGM